MKFYKKNRQVIFLLIVVVLSGVLILWFSPRRYTAQNMSGIIAFLIGSVIIFPILLSWSIAVNDDSIYALYSLFDQVILIRRKIEFKNIRRITVNDVGWFVILPVKDSDKYRLNEIIIIQRDIKNYRELMSEILNKVNPVVVEDKVRLLLKK